MDGSRRRLCNWQRLLLPKGAKRKEWRKVSGDHYGDCSKLQLVCWSVLKDIII